MISRVPGVSIHLKLKNKGKVVLSRTFPLATRVYSQLERSSTPEWTLGVCRVWYNREKDYWNEFEFKTAEELHRILAQDTEKDLVETFA